MNGTAMIPDPPAVRGGPRPGIRGGIIAGGRGLALGGVMLAGLGLLLVPFLALFLLGLGSGVLIVGNGMNPSRRMLLVLLVILAGVVIGRLFVLPALLAMRRLAILTRRLAGEWCGVPIAEAYLPPPGTGLGRLRFEQRLWWLVSDPATWRDMLWMLVNAVFGWVIAVLPAALAGLGLIGFIYPAVRPGTGVAPPAFPGYGRTTLLVIGVAFVLAGVASAQWLLRGYFGLAGSLLAPTGQAELALRVHHLAETRSETIDSSATEIRRIERDLHDGAQARLVAVGMTLGAAEELIGSSPEAARACSRKPGRRPPGPWPSCARWSAASIRRCWPTAAWPTRCAPSSSTAA